jgi:hypothetical protein
VRAIERKRQLLTTKRDRDREKRERERYLDVSVGSHCLSHLAGIHRVTTIVPVLVETRFA